MKNYLNDRHNSHTKDGGNYGCENRGKSEVEVRPGADSETRRAREQGSASVDFQLQRAALIRVKAHLALPLRGEATRWKLRNVHERPSAADTSYDNVEEDKDILFWRMESISVEWLFSIQ